MVRARSAVDEFPECGHLNDGVGSVGVIVAVEEVGARAGIDGDGSGDDIADGVGDVPAGECVVERFSGGFAFADVIGAGVAVRSGHLVGPIAASGERGVPYVGDVGERDGQRDVDRVGVAVGGVMRGHDAASCGGGGHGGKYAGVSGSSQ